MGSREEIQEMLRAPGEEIQGSNQQMQIDNRRVERVGNANYMTSFRDPSERNVMPITYETGQIRYGPPMNHEQIARPGKGTEIFVSKIPRDFTERVLIPIFQMAGRIYEMRLMMNYHGGNRGYCFVRYYTKEEADRAVRELHNFKIRERRAIAARKSFDNCKLILHKLPRDKSEDELSQEINKVVDGVIAVRLCTRPNGNPSFSFIEFSSHQEAAMARRKIWMKKLKLWGVEIRADWARPSEHRNTVMTFNPIRNDLWNTRWNYPLLNSLPAREVVAMFQGSDYDHFPGAPWPYGSDSSVRSPNSNFCRHVHSHPSGGQGYPPSTPNLQTSTNFGQTEMNPASHSRPQHTDRNSIPPVVFAYGLHFGIPGVPPEVYLAQWSRSNVGSPTT